MTQKQLIRCPWVPIIIDFVENRSKSRYLTSFLVLLVYLLTIFIIFSNISQPIIQISGLKVQSGLGAQILINRLVNQTTILPRVKLVSKSKGVSLSNITVFMVLTDLSSDYNEMGDLCNSDNRKKIAGSLQFIRLEQYCQIEIKGNSAMTDASGRAVFEHFKILRGPTGTYTFQYQMSNLKGNFTHESQTFSAYFDSDVMMLKIQEGLPPMNFQIGQPFQSQPKVRVLDIYGNPIQGKKVVAYSWPEGTVISVHANEFLYQSSQYVHLLNCVSEESDENGIARFKNLGIEGMVFASSYIFFNSDNQFQVLWQIPRTTIYDAFSIPIGRYPIYQSGFLEIEMQFEGDYSREVEEGEPFEKPIKIKITDLKTGRPLVGKMAFATIIGYNDTTYPYGYRFHTIPNLRQKELIKPIPGVYHQDFLNPLLLEKLFTPIQTDSNGVLAFEQMYFSIYGPAGKYRLQIWCDGQFVVTEMINVKTSVSKISFIVQPPNFFLQDSMDIELLKPIIRVTNKLGKGVEGQFPTVILKNPNNQNIVYQPDQIALPMNMTLVQTTDGDGVLEILFDFGFAKEQGLVIDFYIEIDGVVSDKSASCEFVDSVKSEENCGNIYYSESINPKEFKEVQLNEKNSFTFTVVNEKGTPIQDAIVIVFFNIEFNSISKVPQSIIPKVTCTDNCQMLLNGMAALSITDQLGQAQFGDLTIIDGVETVYQMVFEALTGLELDKPNRRLLETQQYQSVTQCKNSRVRNNNDWQDDGDRNNNDLEINNDYDCDEDFSLDDHTNQDSKNFEIYNNANEDHDSSDESLQEESTNVRSQIQHELRKINLANLKKQISSKLKTRILQGPVDPLPSDLPSLPTTSSIPSFDIDPDFPELHIDDITQEMTPPIIDSALEQESGDVFDNSQASTTSSLGQQKGQLQECVSEFLMRLQLITNIVYLVDALQNVVVAEGTSTNEPIYQQTYVALDKFFNPKSNYPLKLQIILMNLPGSFVAEYLLLDDKTGYVNKLINFQQLSPETDSEGKIKIQYGLKPQSKGYFAFNLKAENVRSDPFLIQSQFMATQIEIVQQPSSNEKESKPFIAGNFLKEPIQVRVLDSFGQVLSNYPVIANVDRTFGESLFIMEDGSDFNHEDTLAIGPWRVAFSDESGIATFDQLTVAEVRDTKCLKFFFATGDVGPLLPDFQYNFCDSSDDQSRRPGMCAKSESSNIFCFQTEIQVTIMNKDKYSRIITPQTPFDIPIIVQFKYQVLNDLEREKFMFLAGTLYEFDGIKQIDNPTLQTDILLERWFCILKNSLLMTNQQDGSCSIREIVNKNYQKVYQVTFTKLAFKTQKPGFMRLSFSSVYNFKHQNETQFTLQDLQQNTPAEISEFFQKVKDEQPQLQQNLKRLNQVNLIIAMGKSIQELKTQTLEQGSNITTRNLAQITSLASATENIDKVKKFQQDISSVTAQTNNYYIEVLNFILAKEESDETANIIINVKPQSIRIKNEPKTFYYIRDTIRVTVACFSTSKSPVQQIPVTISINPTNPPVEDLGSIGMESLLNKLSGSENPDTIINARSNIRLEERQLIVQTNEFGIANFNVRAITGASGLYNLQFTAKGLSSSMTSNFYLKNNILKVNFIDWKQGIVKSSDLENSVILFQNSNKLTLNITYQPETNVTVYEKDIKILVFNYIDFPDINEVNITNMTKNLIMSRYENAKATDQKEFKALEAIFTIREVVTNGGKFVQQITQSDEGLKLNFNATYLNNGNIEISNLTIQFKSYGQYQLVISVDGINTPSSPQITIEKIKQSDAQDALDILSAFFAVLIIFMILSLNFVQDVQTKSFQIFNISVWAFVLVLDIINIIIFSIELGNATSDTKNFPINSLFFLFGYLYFFFVLLDVGRIIIFQSRDVFTFVKEKMEYRYTYTVLFGRAIKSLDKNSAIETIFQEEKQIFYQQKDTLFYKIKSIFTPFSRAQNHAFIENSFYYPQNFLSALIITKFSLIFIAYKIFVILNNMKTDLLKTLETVVDSYTSFISSSTNYVEFSPFKITEQTFEQLVNALYIGFVISSSVSLLIYVLNNFAILLDFREQTLNARQGIYVGIQKSKIVIANSTKYIPFHVSNATIGFAITAFVFGICITPLFMQLFWEILWEYRYTILSIIASSLLNTIIRKLAIKFAFEGRDAIQWQLLAGIVDFVLALLRIASGIISAIQQFILLILSTTFSFQTIHKTIFPNWIYSLVGGDQITKTYESMFLVYNMHNNPIANTFVRILTESIQQPKLVLTEEQYAISPTHPSLLRKRNLLWMAVMLSQIPPDRKTNFQRKLHIRDSGINEMYNYVSQMELNNSNMAALQILVPDKDQPITPSQYQIIY